MVRKLVDLAESGIGDIYLLTVDGASCTAEDGLRALEAGEP